MHFESVSNLQDVRRRRWSREKEFCVSCFEVRVSLQRECTNFHRTEADEHVVAEATDFLSCFKFVRLKLFMERVDDL